MKPGCAELSGGFGNTPIQDQTVLQNMTVTGSRLRVVWSFLLSDCSARGCERQPRVWVVPEGCGLEKQSNASWALVRVNKSIHELISRGLWAFITFLQELLQPGKALGRRKASQAVPGPFLAQLPLRPQPKSFLSGMTQVLEPVLVLP